MLIFQLFTAPVFSSCLFLEHFIFRFRFGELDSEREHFHFSALKKSFEVHCRSLSICKENFDEFRSFWLNASTRLYRSTLLFIAVTSSVNKREAAVNPPTPKDEMLRFRLWAVPSFLHTPPFPSFCYMMICTASLQRIVCRLFFGILIYLFLSLWWSLFVIVDFDFGLHLANCCEIVFLQGKKSYSIAVFFSWLG